MNETLKALNAGYDNLRKENTELLQENERYKKALEETVKFNNPMIARQVLEENRNESKRIINSTSRTR